VRKGRPCCASLPSCSLHPASRALAALFEENPRKYEHGAALSAAIQTFWKKGYSATTFDDLVIALGMNKPSLYLAFADKTTLYELALQHFVSELRSTLEVRVMQEPDLRKALRSLYDDALAVYFAEEPALGCFLFCTAPVEAAEHPQIKAVLEASLSELDQLLARRIRVSQKAGQFSAARGALVTGRLAQSVLHSLAVRARAGESRPALARFAREVVDWMFA
jgi:TetR/AcrR family transcriptional regulator, copper-responsive repressor